MTFYFTFIKWEQEIWEIQLKRFNQRLPYNVWWAGGRASRGSINTDTRNCQSFQIHLSIGLFSNGVVHSPCMQPARPHSDWQHWARTRTCGRWNLQDLQPWWRQKCVHLSPRPWMTGSVHDIPTKPPQSTPTHKKYKSHQNKSFTQQVELQK